MSDSYKDVSNGVVVNPSTQYLDANFLIDALLLLFDLLLNLLQRGGVGRCAVGFEYLNIPSLY